MSRPTPSVSLCEKDAIALKTIMENSPEDSSHFKRAAVILACAEGKQGKDIAKEYHITPNMVINWRRKFENGGVDGLMSDAPRPGKRVTDDKTISSPTQLSTKKSLDNTPSETVPNVSDTIKHIIQEKKVQIIGLFLTLSVQIIALVISPLSKESPFPKGKCITVNTGSTQSQEQTTDDIEILDVTNTLRCLPSLTPREETNPTEDAFNFIENLKNSLEETGSQLYLVLNAPDPVALVQDQSCIGMQLSSVEEFKSTASLWLRSLEGGNHWVSDVFSKHLTRLLNTAPAHCAPFTWQVTPKEYHPKTASSTRTLSAGENEVTFSITYKDSTGATRTCSKVLVNEIPNSEDFSQCKTIYDFQRLAGKLEQGIIRGSQELGNAFMKETIQAGSSKDQKKKEESTEPRIIEIESMLGRTKCPLPEDVDTVSLFSRSRLYTPELATIAMNLAENMPYGKAATFLNRTQHRSDNAVLNSVALNSCIIHWGTEIHQEQLTQAKQALLEFGFDPETGKVQEGVTLPSSITEPVIPEGEVEEAALNFIQVLNEYMQKYPDTPIDIAEVASSLECPSHTTILMIDDISVKRQKEERSVNGKEGQKSAKTVINTVIWIRSPEGVYAIAAENTRQGLLMALGYMLKNHLLENRELLIFFDGAKVIRSNVEEIFAFHAPLKFYLDWYHVCKRISENLSMGLKCGKENREKNEELIKEILKKIWFNQIDKAIDILESIDRGMIRNQRKIIDTINYLNDRRPYLYNYAARKITGLINSSNRVEDMNDQVVARRQKNKGMSWSAQGSHGLAALTTLSVNDEASTWISYGTVRFTPKQAKCAAA